MTIGIVRSPGVLGALDYVQDFLQFIYCSLQSVCSNELSFFFVFLYFFRQSYIVFQNPQRAHHHSQAFAVWRLCNEVSQSKPINSLEANESGQVSSLRPGRFPPTVPRGDLEPPRSSPPAWSSFSLPGFTPGCNWQFSVFVQYNLAPLWLSIRVCILTSHWKYQTALFGHSHVAITLSVSLRKLMY